MSHFHSYCSGDHPTLKIQSLLLFVSVKDNTKVDTTYIKNEQYTNSQVSVGIHSNWQKRCRLNKKKTNSHEDIKNLSGVYTVAAADNHERGLRQKKILNCLIHLLLVLFGASSFGEAQLRQAAEDKLQPLLQKQHQRTLLLLFS